MIGQKTINIIVIFLIVLLCIIIGYNLYEAADKKKQERIILQRDSIRTIELNKKICKIDSLGIILLKQDSILIKETNVLKKKYKERKKDIDNNRNTLPTLPNF